MNEIQKQSSDVNLANDSFEIAEQVVRDIITPLLIAKERKSGESQSKQLFHALVYNLYSLHKSAIGEGAGDEMRDIIEMAELHAGLVGVVSDSDAMESKIVTPVSKIYS